jgi:hypothetical protein
VRERVKDRELAIWEGQEGISEVYGRLFSTDAKALDQRLDSLLATVCDADPRTRDQLRADALGALAAGAERLGCGCGTPECDAGTRAAGPVVVHVIAEQASLDGRSSTPAATLDGQELIPAELLAELAKTAKQRPLIVPMGPEPGYTPSAKLAEFVRCRDLTCRAPGCDRPATHCDVDHTIPYADGGATHASNLKCLCRFHHLMKTFWGWRDQQLPDGTVIWTLPDGRTYVTTPGSALLFPSLCLPTGDLPPVEAPTQPRCGNRTAMMPLRATTRAQNRARYVAAERALNHKLRQAARQACGSQPFHSTDPPPGDDDPPPF